MTSYRFALYNYAGTPVAYYQVDEVPLPVTNTAVVTVPAHLVLVVDRSGPMSYDMAPLKGMIEKVLTLEEYTNSDLYVSVVSSSSSGDVTKHFDHIKVSDVMKPGSQYIEEVRKIRATALTCISQGLVEAKKLVRPGELTCVVLHSDGFANDPSPRAEMKEMDNLITEFKKMDNVFVNTIAYNSWSDFKLLSRVANECSGVCLQAVNVKQVYDALHNTATLLAGRVTPAIKVNVDKADYLAFVSMAANRVNGSSGDLTVTGLKASDDRIAYRYIKMNETDYKASKLPECGHGAGKAPLTAVYAYSRSMIAEGYINSAKYAMVSTQNVPLLETHAKALTNSELANFAAGLEDAIFNGAQTKGNFQDTYGLDVTQASVLDICGVLGANAFALQVDMKHLSKNYVRRGIKRIPGSRAEDGTVTLPEVTTIFKDDGAMATVGGFETNRNNATINMMVIRDVYLAKASDNAVIADVAGVKLNDLKSFNNYTIVGDGTLNVAELKLRINNKKSFKALADIGAVTGDFDPKQDYIIKFEGRPMVSFRQTFGPLG